METDCVFFNDKSELQGIRINKVEGEKIFFSENNLKIRKGTTVYRNYDHEFGKILSKKTAERKIAAELVLRETKHGFAIDAKDEDGNSVSTGFSFQKEIAQKSQAENIKNNLSKTGNTIFNISSIHNRLQENWFIPASVLSGWRRTLMEKLMQVRLISYRRQKLVIPETSHPFSSGKINYLGNVTNEKSLLFYRQHKSETIEYGFEKSPLKNVPLMFTKHCIKYSLGICPKYTLNPSHSKSPLYLVSENIRLKLSFDCTKCEMEIFME